MLSKKRGKQIVIKIMSFMEISAKKKWAKTKYIIHIIILKIAVE